MFKTITEKKGYAYSRGCGGKKWKRGRTVFSEGKAWIGQNDYVYCITKTNLDTGEVTLASLKEHERFLTPESFSEFVVNTFERLTKIS